MADLRPDGNAELESALEAAGYNVRMLNQVQYHWSCSTRSTAAPDFVAALKAAG